MKSVPDIEKIDKGIAFQPSACANEKKFCLVNAAKQNFPLSTMLIGDVAYSGSRNWMAVHRSVVVYLIVMSKRLSLSVTGPGSLMFNAEPKAGCRSAK